MTQELVIEAGRTERHYWQDLPGRLEAWQEDVYHPPALIVRLNVKGCNVIPIRVGRASAIEMTDYADFLLAQKCAR